MTGSSLEARTANASESVPRASVTPTSASRWRPPAAGSTSAAKPVMTPRLAQAAHAVGGGVGGQADGGAEVAPRHPPVLTEEPEDLTVCRVHRYVSRGRCAGAACGFRSVADIPGPCTLLTIGFGLGFLVAHAARADVALPHPLDAARRLGGRARDRRRDRAGGRALRGRGRRRRGVAAGDRSAAHDALAARRRGAACSSASRTLRDAFRVRLGAETDDEVASPRRAFATSAAATASNPLTIASWAAVFAAAQRRRARPARRCCSSPASASAASCWVTLLATGTAAARRALGVRAMRIADALRRRRAHLLRLRAGAASRLSVAGERRADPKEPAAVASSRPARRAHARRPARGCRPSRGRPSRP